MLSQRVIDKPAAGILVLHSIGRADVGLVGKKDNNRGIFPLGRISQYFRRDLTARNLRRAAAPLTALWIRGEGGHSRGDAKRDQHQEYANPAKDKAEQEVQTRETILRT